MTDVDDLVERLLDGEHRALARAITIIENREDGYRDLVSALHGHTGNAEIIGVTGSPGAGKSTLVDKMAEAYRDRGLTVGVIAVDPSSPFTGGAVLGDRVRMASTVADMDVFVRSMSARGHLGGLSAATTDAVTALDAFGKDRVIVETVGAGQNEVAVVETADTVAVLVQPGSGDDVQMLKAGILEIGDVFVVNKADKPGADQMVQQLREMLGMRDGGGRPGHSGGGERGDGGGAGDGEPGAVDGESEQTWTPPVVETVATTGEGVAELLDVLADHRAFLESSGQLVETTRDRYAEEIRTLLRDDAATLLEDEIAARGGIESLVDAVMARETDPYTIADEIVGPIADCLERERPDTTDESPE